MGEPTLPLQAAIRARLLDSEAVMMLVPPDNVRDWTAAPPVSHSIVIGEGQSVFSDYHANAYFNLHIWVKEPGLRIAKEIADAAINAIDGQRWTVPGLFVSDMGVDGTRYLRDPAGEFSHGIISVRAIVQERAA